MFGMDVYALTIAANCCNGYQRVGYKEYFYALRLCMYCYIFQSMIATFFAYSELAFDGFKLENWSTETCVMRLICCCLLQVTLNRESQKATKMMAWVKHEKVTL